MYFLDIYQQYPYSSLPPPLGNITQLLFHNAAHGPEDDPRYSFITELADEFTEELISDVSRELASDLTKISQ